MKSSTHWLAAGVGLWVMTSFVMVMPFLIMAAATAGGEPGEGTSVRVKGIPAVMLKAYWRAANATSKLVPACKGMRWQILAGVGRIESDHAMWPGRTIAANGDISPPILGPRLDGNDNTQRISDTDDGRWDHDSVYDRAVGPMQFIPSTWDGPWENFGRDGNDDGVADPNNAYDATYAAVVHLCGKRSRDFGRDDHLAEALFRYNPMHSYVRRVMAWIDHYDRIAVKRAPTPRGTRRVVLPMPEGVYRITSRYGPRPDPFGSGSAWHHGLDFAASEGTSILAVADGTVRRAGMIGTGGAGQIDIVHVIDGRRVATRYKHMWPWGIDVRPGLRVAAGQRIGAVGSSGHSTGPHLHLEVRLGGLGGDRTDPEDWLEQHRAAGKGAL